MENLVTLATVPVLFDVGMDLSYITHRKLKVSDQSFRVEDITTRQMKALAHETGAIVDRCSKDVKAPTARTRVRRAGN